MVQNKKNFSSGKKQMAGSSDLSRKGQDQSRTTGTDRALDTNTARSNSTAGRAGQSDVSSKDKSSVGISKRDTGSRK